jgi:V/A-type H+-transporting ATPase subunit I
MAVARMSLVGLTGPLSLFDQCIEQYVVPYDFHVENAFSVLKNVHGLLPFKPSNPYKELLQEVETTAASLGISPKFTERPSHPPALEDIRDFTENINEQLRKWQEKEDQLNKQLEEDSLLLSQLSHLQELDVDLSTLFHLVYVKIRFGRLPRETYKLYHLNLEKNPQLIFVPTSFEKEYVYGFYLTTRTNEESTDALLLSLHFERSRISNHASGTPAEAEKSIAVAMEAAKAELSKLTFLRKDLAEASREKLLSYYSYLTFTSQIHEIRRFAAHTNELFYLVGWVPDDSVPRLSEAVAQNPQIACTLESAKSLPQESANPPILLKNPKLFRPFESLVATYGLPAYNEVDPTGLMAITMPLLFGLMFGDVGQGLVLFLAGLLLYHKTRKPLGQIIAIVGVVSTLFGFVYGSVFGNEEILGFGFHILSNTEILLIGTIGLGVVLMSIGMWINIANGIKQKDLKKALFSSKGVAGLLLYWGVLFAAILLLVFSRNVLAPWYIGLFVVFPLLLMFLAGPLSALLQRKKDWMPKNKVEYVLVNFFELFEDIVSFISNTVSFVRIGALALNHAGMMMVVFILAEGLSGAGNILVLILGNLFVIALEGLIVGIQCLRLEFYEIFGKFYSGTGRPYDKFKIQTH